MSTQALLLVVTAALMHAVWNLIAKKTKGNLTFVWLVSIASAVIYLPFVIRQLTHYEIASTTDRYIFASVSAVLHLLYFVVLQLGYRKADFSMVYALARGTGPLLSASGAMLFLVERPGWMAISGIALIILGILVMTGLKLRFSNNAKLKAGTFYGIITGLFIATYTLLQLF
jgi:drug/metabolite transporter (DMT)-like permease